MKRVFLGRDKTCFEYETLEQLREECKKYGVSIGNDVSIGDGVSIGYVVSICSPRRHMAMKIYGCFIFNLIKK